MANKSHSAGTKKGSNKSSVISAMSTTTTPAINLQPEALYEKLYYLAEKLASTKLGQFAIGKIDHVLSTVEDTAKWSLPNTEFAVPRPLPWIPFLTMIVLLRAIRISLSVGLILIGNEPVSARELIYFIQTRRRKLRAIKYHGLNTIRIKTTESKKDSQQGIISQINSLLSSIICRSGNFNNNDDDGQVKIIIQKNKQNKKADNKKERSSLNTTKPEGIHNGHDNEEQDELTDSDADQNTSDDIDYNPENDCSEESDEETSDNDQEEEVVLYEELDTIRKNIEERLLEFTKKKEEENIEKNKNLIDEIIKEKRGEIEEELKSKLELQIEERIKQHANILLNKLDEKFEEIQQKDDNSNLRNISNIHFPIQNGVPEVAEEDQHIKENESKNNYAISANSNFLLEDIFMDGNMNKGKGSPMIFPGNIENDNTLNGMFSEANDFSIKNKKIENFDNKTFIRGESEAATYQKFKATSTERRENIKTKTPGKATNKQDI